MNRPVFEHFDAHRAANLDPNRLPPTLLEAVEDYLKPAATRATRERRLHKIGTVLAHLDLAGRRIGVAIQEGDEVVEIATGCVDE